MSMIRWSPFREFDDLFANYRGMMGRGALRGLDSDDAGEVFLWQPTSDISETDKEYLVRAELPEVSRDDVDVSFENGVLRLQGERRYEKRTDDEKQHRTESMYGRFYRAFSMPENIDADGIQANMKDGVLTVRIPKTAVAPETTKKIQIK